MTRKMDLPPLPDDMGCEIMEFLGNRFIAKVFPKGKKNTCWQVGIGDTPREATLDALEYWDRQQKREQRSRDRKALGLTNNKLPNYHHYKQRWIWAEKLRNEGATYKKIAEEIGVSSVTARGYVIRIHRLKLKGKYSQNIYRTGDPYSEFKAHYDSVMNSECNRDQCVTSDQGMTSGDAITD
jgi:hypothetical protein